MTIETEQFANDRTAYLQSARRQADDWRDKLTELQYEIEKLSSETQAEYQRTLTELREQWQEVEARFTELEQARDMRWEDNQLRWEETATDYGQSFAQFANRMHKEEVPLGWLEGYTDERIHDSVGWAEGQGGHPGESEGWAEGQGRQEPDSKGWAEGYDKTQS